jgi:hypothetical protein
MAPRRACPTSVATGARRSLLVNPQETIVPAHERGLHTFLAQVGGGRTRGCCFTPSISQTVTWNGRVYAQRHGRKG